ncbi:MAG: T9SS type A sorting domain-containing protein, partial [Balneola sp.]
LAGNPFKVTANIFNQGTVDAENVVVKIELFDGLTLVGEDSVINEAALPGQQSLTVEWMVRADKNVSGPNRYTVSVDADNAEAKQANRSISIPDLIAPSAPSNLSSMISPDNENNITLNWSLNSETDLAGYLVYYGSESGIYDGVDANEGESPITISTFEEFELSGLPDGGSQYFFVVKAFDLSGNVSDASNESSTTITTDIFDETETPEQYFIEQNYPNPFNPSTNITYKVPETANVTITLYDMLGRKLSTLVNERKTAGSYQITLDMSSYSSGIYLYRMQSGTFIKTRRLTLIK